MEVVVGGEGGDLQPINLPIVREGEDEFVDDPVDADGAADELQLRIRGVAEDEVVAVEVGQLGAADAACYLLLLCQLSI